LWVLHEKKKRNKNGIKRDGKGVSKEKNRGEWERKKIFPWGQLEPSKSRGGKKPKSFKMRLAIE